jgi:hypothetical protein
MTRTQLQQGMGLDAGYSMGECWDAEIPRCEDAQYLTLSALGLELICGRREDGEIGIDNWQPKIKNNP